MKYYTVCSRIQGDTYWIPIFAMRFNSKEDAEFELNKILPYENLKLKEYAILEHIETVVLKVPTEHNFGL